MTTTTTDNGNRSFDIDRWQRGGMTSFAETCFAEYWDSINPDKIMRQAVDPFSFEHRMALGQYLIENTGGEAL